MPRITAGSVAEHVAQQERAVFDAAIGLFIERGYKAVTLGDIAQAVGLARNSLYRYFPTKASILMRWYAEEMPTQIQRSIDLLSGQDEPSVRIDRWATAQIDYALKPEHRLIAALGEAAEDLDPAARTVLAASHDQLMAPFHAALAEAGVPEAERPATADLIWNAVLGQARRELRTGEDLDGRVVLSRCIDSLARPA